MARGRRAARGDGLTSRAVVKNGAGRTVTLPSGYATADLETAVRRGILGTLEDVGEGAPPVRERLFLESNPAAESGSLHYLLRP